MVKREIPSPLIKWAGGKRQLLHHIDKRLPASFNKYYEPFFGGGALFFHLQPKDAILNDLNPALINLYKQVRDNCETYKQILSQIDFELQKNETGTSDYFYTARAHFNELLASNTFNVETAALLTFINKHCFNGLYRVNGKGAFNVPYNKSLKPSFDPTNTDAVSLALVHAELQCGDFADSVSNAKADDFIFFDSPYVPLNDNTFEAYTKEGFSEKDHYRLASLFYELDKRNCKLMLTNHDTPLIRKLYLNYKIDVIDVKRSINSNAKNRQGTEVIITNYLD